MKEAFFSEFIGLCVQRNVMLQAHFAARAYQCMYAWIRIKHKMSISMPVTRTGYEPI